MRIPRLVIGLPLLFAAVLQAAAKQPILLDTDFGTEVDDAVALSLLLASPEVDLLAVTTCGGDSEDRAWMVCRLLTMADRRKIPVAWGREPRPKREASDRDPLSRPLPVLEVREMYQYRYHPAVLFNRTAKPVKDDAADLLYACLKEQPKKTTTLLAIGPLTNVARLLEKHPDSKELLGRIVFRGGNLDLREAPEWNIAQDVTAAQAVLASGVPLVMAPIHGGSYSLGETFESELIVAQTMLTQQLQTLLELSPGPGNYLHDATATAVVIDDKFGLRRKQKIKIDDDALTRAPAGEPNVEVVVETDGTQFEQHLARIAKFGPAVKPRPLTNFATLIERTGLPARVHAFEDYETDIEKRWWLAGRLLIDDPPLRKRAFKSVLTLDFDDLQGDLKTMYSAVVFNPVPGPPMGKNTRLSFRYRLEGTDQLRVQLYSLSNGYHRYLALKDLPRDKWQEGTVDMTDMRRPDGSGGALAEDERIDDIQFYVAPTARVSIDDVVLYDAARDDEKEPFPARIVFTGWFDTGKQGNEWPGDFAIVEHEKPRKWKAAKSVAHTEGEGHWLRVSFRGERPIGKNTAVRFNYRLQGSDNFTVELANSKSKHSVQQAVKPDKPGEWSQTTLRFNTSTGGFSSANELRFLLAKEGELLVDDVLVYEPEGANRAAP